MSQNTKNIRPLLYKEIIRLSRQVESIRKENESNNQYKRRIETLYAKQWFLDDMNVGSHICVCHVNIKYIYKIKNKYTSEILKIGSTCVEHFSKSIADECQLAIKIYKRRKRNPGGICFLCTKKACKCTRQSYSICPDCGKYHLALDLMRHMRTNKEHKSDSYAKVSESTKDFIHKEQKPLRDEILSLEMDIRDEFNHIIIPFSKYKGKTIRHIKKYDRSYFNWMLKNFKGDQYPINRSLTKYKELQKKRLELII